MKIDAAKLRQVVNSMLAEASKKKSKKEMEAEKKAAEGTPAGYSKSESLDFSVPLGANNRYAQQGQANFGPYTGKGSRLDGQFSPWKSLLDYLGSLEESKAPPKTSWEQAKVAFLKRGEK